MSRDEGARSVKELFDLSGRRALITGAANAGGFGRQIAEALAEAGAELILTSRDGAKAEGRAEALRRGGLSAHGRALDLRDPAAIEALISEVEASVGPLDVVVNNASDNCLERVEEVAVEDWERVLSVNITGAMLLSRAVAPAMRRRGRGVILNVSSIYGVVSPDQRIYGDSGLNSPLVYGVSKAALIQMTRYLATYWAPEIRVNCVTPGGLWNEQPVEFLEAYQARTPLGRMAGRSDLKGAALYLCSDASAWVTGENLVVDGGWTVW